MRYFVELSYLGTAFHGWQRQPNAPSVQEELEKALGLLLKQDIAVVGSSRTDTGVHAEQQFAHIDLPEPIEEVGSLVYRLNAVLPPTIAVQGLYAVADDCHARFAATHRRYRYQIARVKDPFLLGQAYYYTVPLDVAAMNEAAALLLQYTDFECFSKVHTDVFTFNCSITEAYWETTDQRLIFHIRANRFLRGMVRAIVGTLLDVGKGKRSIQDFERLILEKNRKKAGPQAPAHGLFLTEVGYPKEILRSHPNG